jgi:hypothetical protein
MISVITPIRGRYEDTLRTIQSAYDLADKPDEVEMLFRVDEDDKELIGRKFPSFPNLKFYEGPRLLGYASLHHMVNELCEVSKGEMIMTFGNDARFKSKGWDSMYEEESHHCHGICVVHIKKTKENKSGTQFPMITRRLYNILGHYSLSPSIDDYLTWLGMRARCMFYSNVEVDHDHTVDDIAEEKEKRVPFILQEFRGSAMQRVINEDAKKVSLAIGELDLADWIQDIWGKKK